MSVDWASQSAVFTGTHTGLHSVPLGDAINTPFSRARGHGGALVRRATVTTLIKASAVSQARIRAVDWSGGLKVVKYAKAIVTWPKTQSKVSGSVSNANSSSE